jgi:hypothetical protein
MSAWAAYSSRNVFPLFPKLRQLEWNIRNDHDEHLISPFLGPALEQLTLTPERAQFYSGRFTTDDQNYSANSVIRKVALSCPSWLSLNMAVTLSTDSLLFHAFERLQVFRSSNLAITKTLFRSLMRLPNLRTLDAVFCQDAESALHPIPDIMFPALHTLIAREITESCSTKLVLAIQSRMMRSLSFDQCAVAQIYMGCQGLLRAIGKFASSGSLQELVIRADGKRLLR